MHFILLLTSKLPPHHLVDYTHIALYDFHYFGADIFIYVVGYRDSVVTVFAKLYGSIYCLQETLGVDASNDEVAFVNGFGTFCTCANADGREWMSHAGKETALFRKGAAVADYSKGIHLETVVVVEAERLVLDDTLVKLEAAGGKAVA